MLVLLLEGGNLLLVTRVLGVQGKYLLALLIDLKLEATELSCQLYGVIFKRA